MRMASKVSALAVIVLSGCATIPNAEIREPKNKVTEVPAIEAGGFDCVADTIQYAIGKQATAELGGRLLKESGSTLLRWIPPDTAITMDYRIERLNISYDYKMLITDLSCG